MVESTYYMYMCTLLSDYRIMDRTGHHSSFLLIFFREFLTSAKMFLHSALGRHAESVELWSALDLSLASTDQPTRLQFALAMFRAGNYTESLQGNHTPPVCLSLSVCLSLPESVCLSESA